MKDKRTGRGVQNREGWGQSRRILDALGLNVICGQHDGAGATPASSTAILSACQTHYTHTIAY